MNTKEIIAAFRSGQMPEEEAVVRLASLCRQKSSSGVQAETSSQADTNGHLNNGVGSSQTDQSTLTSIPSHGQSSKTQVSGPAPAKDSGTAPSCDIAVIGTVGKIPGNCRRC